MSSTTINPRDPGLAATDPDIATLIDAEHERQRQKIRLIPSENYASRAVLEACGSALQNKYSEGYPKKRYYEGQQFIDAIEELAITRAKTLFKVDHANVQPYSGSPANLAVLMAFVKPGETIMGMSLPHGGHLTHGWNVSISGKFFRSVSYGVKKETGRVDLNEVREIALRERPKLIFCGGTAIPRTVDFNGFSSIAKEAGAVLCADIAHIAGLVAGGAHPSPAGVADVISTTTHKTLRGPRGGMLMCKTEHTSAIDKAVFPGLQGGPHNQTTAGIAVALKEAAGEGFKHYAAQIVANAKVLAETLTGHGFELVSGGTDNHLILVDLTNKGVAGKKAAQALDRAGVVCNYNTVPFDPRKPFDPSGIRLGTPAVTSRGMGAPEMRQIGEFIARGVDAAARDDEAALGKILHEVRALTEGFPAPGLGVHKAVEKV
jgi:glycine hydroxymethyltransferase